MSDESEFDAVKYGDRSTFSVLRKRLLCWLGWLDIFSQFPGFACPSVEETGPCFAAAEGGIWRTGLEDLNSLQKASVDFNWKTRFDCDGTGGTPITAGFVEFVEEVVTDNWPKTRGIPDVRVLSWDFRAGTADTDRTQAGFRSAGFTDGNPAETKDEDFF